MKRRIEIIPSESPNLFKIGKTFFLLKQQKIKDNHIDKLVFESVDKKDYRNKIGKVADEILKTKDIDSRTILIQALADLPTDDLNNLMKKLKSKKPKYKKGCLSLEVDGIEIPIFTRASALQ